MSRLAQFAWAVLGYNLVVVVWGGFVRASGSGAGCGSHWPLCNGEVVPRDPSVATLIELAHRITSGLALMLVLVLLVWSFRGTRRASPVRLGAALSFAVHLAGGRDRRRPRASGEGRAGLVAGARRMARGSPRQHLPPARLPHADGLVGLRRTADAGPRRQALGVDCRVRCSPRRWSSA